MIGRYNNLHSLTITDTIKGVPVKVKVKRDFITLLRSSGPGVSHVIVDAVGSVFRWAGEEYLIVNIRYLCSPTESWYSMDLGSYWHGPSRLAWNDRQAALTNAPVKRLCKICERALKRETSHTKV